MPDGLRCSKRDITAHLKKHKSGAARSLVNVNDETRTRVALIDPLLRALGWDVADPAVVMPEYKVGNRSADYALLRCDGRVDAALEAKRLGESLGSHREQMLTHTNMAGIGYAGLADGNRWELYEVFKAGHLEERRLLDVSIAKAPAHASALKLLLLWRPNLSSGQPVEAGTPLFDDPLFVPRLEAALALEAL